MQHREERLPLARELVALALPRGALTLGQQGYARIAVDCFELGDLAGAEIAIAAHERLGQALGHARWRWRGPLLRSMRALLLGPLGGCRPGPGRCRRAAGRGR